MPGVNWCSSRAELQKIVCWAVSVLTQQKLPGDLGCGSKCILGLHCYHPSTQRRCCRLLWYCMTARAIEIGAFWACSVVDNNLGMTSEIKLFAGPYLGCCSAMLHPANHSYSRGEKHSLRKQLLEEGLLKKCDFSGTCFCLILMQTERHPPPTHIPVALVQLKLVCCGAPGRGWLTACPGEHIASMICSL